MPQPTQELQGAIQMLHAAIATEPDPEDKAALTQCLQNMMKVQAKNMQQEGQGPNGGPPPGQGPAAPPPGPPPEAMEDPRAALMAQLGGGGGAPF
jgi:hypothetical protein